MQLTGHVTHLSQVDNIAVHQTDFTQATTNSERQQRTFPIYRRQQMYRSLGNVDHGSFGDLNVIDDFSRYTHSTGHATGYDTLVTNVEISQEPGLKLMLCVRYIGNCILQHVDQSLISNFINCTYISF